MSKPPLALTEESENELSLSGAILSGLLQDVLSKDRPFRFRAMGTSMYPFVRDGDIILVSTLHEEQPRLGDVVACLHPGTNRLIVHRILQKRGATYFVRGDNAPDADGWFPREDILGRVIRVERNGKEVRLGLGMERWLIAALARTRWLIPVVHCSAWRMLIPFARRMRS